MNIIVALVIFSLIVIIHEFGHFLLAKTNGIEVTEFSVGMGPRLITIVKTQKGLKIKLLCSSKEFESREEWLHRTKYSIKLLPLGGSCMMLGEEEEIESEHSFLSKSVYARMSVIFAGPLFNFIFAFILALIIVGAAGYDPPSISYIENGLPMSEAGILAGDKITNMGGEAIYLQREISAYLQFHPLSESPVKITYVRDGKKKTVSVTPIEVADENGVQNYKLGFSFGNDRIKVGPLQTMKYAAYEVRYWVVTTVKTLGMLVTGKVSTKDLAGPVGIVNMVGDVIEDSEPYGMNTVLLTLLNFSILLSANLGVMNLLPIPALDGGRLLFLLVEWVRGKPINREKEGWINLVGFVALMALMVYVMFNDISRLL